MNPEKLHSLDRILECAAVVSWADLMPLNGSGLIHIDYAFCPGGTIEYLKLWASTTRGHWRLVCEYWMSDSSFHLRGIHFEVGYKSEDLAHSLELIMRHQSAFVASPNLGRNGLLQIQQPTQEQIEAAGAAVAEAREHIRSVPMQPAMVSCCIKIRENAENKRVEFSDLSASRHQCKQQDERSWKSPLPGKQHCGKKHDQRAPCQVAYRLLCDGASLSL